MPLKSIFFLITILVVVRCYAEDTLSVIIENQYKIKQNNAIIKNNKGNSFISNQHGEATIMSNLPDSFTIYAKEHDQKTVYLSSKTNQGFQIILNKHFTYRDLLTPMFYVLNGGLWVLLFVIFAETGLFAGFFLPGDSLLFVSGIYSSEVIGNTFKGIPNPLLDLSILWLMICAVGIMGNIFGYYFGKQVGHKIYKWKDSFIFKQSYLQQADHFYKRYGSSAIVLARFLPIVRTFAPILAGIVSMRPKKFMLYNIIGCIAWSFSMVFSGHYLQEFILYKFKFDLREHLEPIVLVIVLVTTLPIIIRFALPYMRIKKHPTK
ncbi:MAG: DedA family protein [Phycisphaerales bacterium]|nr:DedA family protein [Phycisphaerales bacterium]